MLRHFEWNDVAAPAPALDNSIVLLLCVVLTKYYIVDSGSDVNKQGLLAAYSVQKAKNYNNNTVTHS